ncbi:alcohol dehydrogenase 2 [Fusarium beomiforme]|uniref:Alcohol dehydrogenase 2 n=1 Tax=Fusarium beomiforme TaxID=44412 RepID=A0A9P5DV20_9HYPO|nr:alcohol dehydrogenase 2 [Fusarium beomiforme]
MSTSIPSLQKAALIENPGTDARVVIRSDIPVKTPDLGEVLIKLNFTGVCGSEIRALSGWGPYNPIVGHEGVGTVVKVGEGVDADFLNKRVGVKWLYSSCRSCTICKRGYYNNCPDQLNTGKHVPGTLQEYMIADAKHITEIPDGLPGEVAAPLLCAGLTMAGAVSKLNGYAEKGDWVVISGSGGGLGHLGVQIASRLNGLRVIAIDTGESRRKLSFESGAEHFIDFVTDNVEERVKEVTGKEGAPAVLVVTGSQEAFLQAPSLVRNMGIIVTIGLPRNDFNIPLSATICSARSLTVTGVAVGTEEQMRELLQHALNGTIVPEVKVLEFEEACPICWTVWRNIRSSPFAKPSDEPVVGFEVKGELRSCQPDDDEYSITITPNNEDFHEFHFKVKKTTEESFIEKKAPIARQQTPESTARAARAWLSTCDREHDRCNKRSLPPDSATMPTRLLDVGDRGSAAWRIYETENRVSYVALSHRWSDKTPKLLETNYQLYHKHQPDNILPQSYQDIIAICREIPIRYVWIDSLCILQDDQGRDFEQEAPKMVDIYQHAFLTLTICWDLSDGTVFRTCEPRSTPRPQPTDHLAVVSCGEPSRRDYAFVQPEYINRDKLGFEADVSHAPINRRAWVLQERCLSRRIIYLGSDQIYWECDGSGNGHYGCGLVMSQVANSYYVGRESIYIHHGSFHWSTLVSRYTQCELTFEKDRFVAIGGLAKELARSTGYTYVAGIWLESWMTDVYWQPTMARNSSSIHLQMPGPRHKFTAPTWSWLDYPGSVHPDSESLFDLPGAVSIQEGYNQFDDYRLLALLVETIIDPPGCDRFVSFYRAILRIRCLMIPLDLDTIWDLSFDRNYVPLRISRGDQSGSFDWEKLRVESLEDHPEELRMVLSRPLDASSRYHVLPLWLQNISNVAESFFQDVEVYCLVVQEGQNPGEFCRVGTIRSWYTSGLHSIILNTFSMLNSDSSVSISTEEPGATRERDFEHELRDFAAQLGFEVMKHDSIFNASHGRGYDGNNFAENLSAKAASLPYIIKAEWKTISLA